MDILVKPMQRLTKYSLLLKAIHKKTEDEVDAEEEEHLEEEEDLGEEEEVVDEEEEEDLGN